MLRKMGAIAMVTLMLAGCTSSEEEPVATFSADPTSRPFEDGGPSKETDPSESDHDSFLKSTNGENADKATVDRIKKFIQAAVSYTEDSKTKEGYTEYLYYSTSPNDGLQMEFVRYLSSKDSYCLAATSLEFLDLNILYDSQQKRILNEGESCKLPKGQPWGALETSAK